MPNGPFNFAAEALLHSFEKHGPGTFLHGHGWHKWIGGEGNDTTCPESARNDRRRSVLISSQDDRVGVGERDGTWSGCVKGA